MFFFFKQKTAYEMRISDWSSDVCSSDLSRYCFPLHGSGFLLANLLATALLTLTGRNPSILSKGIINQVERHCCCVPQSSVFSPVISAPAATRTKSCRIIQHPRIFLVRPYFHLITPRTEDSTSCKQGGST